MYDFLKGLVILGIKTVWAFCGCMMTVGVFIFCTHYEPLYQRSIFDPHSIHMLIHVALMAIGASAAFTPAFMGMMVLRPIGDAMEERIESDAEDILAFFGIYN
ncbi:hypothetical protein ACTOI6_18875 (plasmid) [Komagataeibacter intermedius]|uniref:hypothetical protein n=1 Tax=Komagataeibacter intermedius TaxID=66229 RepID=UPI0040353189